MVLGVVRLAVRYPHRGVPPHESALCTKRENGKYIYLKSANVAILLRGAPGPKNREGLLNLIGD